MFSRTQRAGSWWLDIVLRSTPWSSLWRWRGQKPRLTWWASARVILIRSNASGCCSTRSISCIIHYNLNHGRLRSYPRWRSSVTSSWESARREPWTCWTRIRTGSPSGQRDHFHSLIWEIMLLSQALITWKQTLSTCFFFSLLGIRWRGKSKAMTWRLTGMILKFYIFLQPFHV